MKYIFAVIITLLFMNLNACSAQVNLQSNDKKLFKVDEIQQEQIIPEENIEIKIKFVNEESPFIKGWWFFKKEQVFVEFSIINKSDSTFYIEPPHYAQFGGNPTFTIESINNKKTLIPKNVSLVNFVPLDFIKMKPRFVYKDTIDVLQGNSYPFIEKERYKLYATYGSQWGAFRDDNNNLKRIWSGSAKSNILIFKYPE